jgi:nicotinate phosphoribosyltransferase
MTPTRVISLLDVDFYKLTMMQLAWKLHPDVVVKYEFINRDKTVKLGDLVNPYGLQVALLSAQSLRFTGGELAYLRSLGIFAEDFLTWLVDFQLPPVKVARTTDNQLSITTEGPWPVAILWETIILSVVNEMYNQEYIDRSPLTLVRTVSEGLARLDAKMELLSKTPVSFTDFGTRRRFSHNWQGLVLDRLNLTSQNFGGTSNVFWAKELGINPVGTYAHEMDMVYCGMKPLFTYEEMKEAHLRMMDDWFAMYGAELSVALTDTYGSDFFFDTIGTERLNQWRGLRQDSGNPYIWATKAMTAFQEAGCDAKFKTLVFSDGLTVESIVGLDAMLHGDVIIRYGWGTDLMNDLGIRPLNIVMKAVEANGNGLVKLSDNMGKALGPYPEEIARIKRLVSYKREEVPA